MHSTSVRCAYFTTSLRVDRVSIAFRSEKESVQRRDHANFAPNSRERIAKSAKNFGAPRAQQLRELGQRGFANRKTSLLLYIDSACVLMQDNARVQRRDHANFAQKSCKKLQNFRKSGTPRAQKNCAHSSIVSCAYLTPSLRVDRVRIAFRSEKSKRPASGSRKFCAQLARKTCKFPEKFRSAARRKIA